MKVVSAIILVLIGWIGPIQAQELPDGKPKEAFVRIINASTVTLDEPWRSGVDLYFKDQKLATDMRAGRSSGYRQIVFTGKDTVDVVPTGKSNRVGSVPASFEKGKFYSIYLVGSVDAAGFKVTPIVATDYPLPPGKLRQGVASVNVFNAVDSFPVRLRVAEGEVVNLTSKKTTEFYFPPGGHSYRLIFPYGESMREMPGEMMLLAGMDYTAVVFASPEKPDRALIRLINNSEHIRDTLEALEAGKAGEAGEAGAVAEPE